MKKLSINGVSLNFIEKNIEQNNAIIFLHGNSHSLKTFSKQMDSHLLKSFRLIFVDLPGHGLSSALESYSVKILSQIMSEFINSLEIKKFIIAGHSLGGHVAINIIKREPLPLGLFLFGTPPLKNPFDVTAFIPNAQVQALGKTQANCEEISTLMEEMNYYGPHKDMAIVDFLNTDPIFRTDILKDVTSFRNEDEVELVKSFKGLVMFLLASKDSLINNTYISQEFLEEENLIAFSEIESGHSPHVEKDVEFNQALADFATQVFNEHKIELTLLRENKNDRQHERSQNE